MKQLILFVVAQLFFFTNVLFSCTAFQVTATDGTLLYCRSMEFEFRLDSDLLIVPREMTFIGTAPGKEKGLQWKTKYGYVGMNQSFAKNLISDGMNEKGLVVGCLYFPGYARYEIPDTAKKDQTIAPWELGSFLLATCETIDQVKSILPTLIVAHEPVVKDFVIPLHFYVSDVSGKAITIEYVDGKRNIYDNPVTALTNSPPFPWHLTNLSNYVNLSPINVSQLQLSQWSIPAIGQGSGLLGLPGDYTPPSRFVRAVLFSKWAISPATPEEAVCLAFHLLNTFDIFDGIVREPETKIPSSPLPTTGRETTEWVVVNDQSHLKTYFRGYRSQKIQMVDLKKINFSKAVLQKIEIEKSFNPEEITIKATPL